MSKSATKTANLPALIPQPGGRGALYAGGVPGNKGGGRHPDWLKRRMAAALRAGDASAVAKEIMTRGEKDADRLRAIDLAAELADLKPKKDVNVAVGITFRLVRE